MKKMTFLSQIMMINRIELDINIGSMMKSLVKSENFSKKKFKEKTLKKRKSASLNME
jgi:hypothetical protein